MTLIIEDGTGVDNANSYDTLDGIRAYAVARGVTLTTNDTELEVLAILAMDYIEGFRADFQGDKTDPLNALQFPRKGVFIDCVAIDDDVMPAELISAQDQLVIEQNNGICLVPTVDEGLILKDEVGPLKTTFSEKIRTDGQPRIRSVDVLLAVLFNSCGQSRGLSAIRI